MQKRWTINKKTKTRHAWAPLFVLLVFLLVASTLIIASSLIKADRLMKQPPLPLPPYATNVLPSFKSVTFRSGKGQITLKGWLVETQKDSIRGTVIMVHDQGGNRLPFGLSSTSLIRRLSQEGFCVLTFDLRHSGESEGELSTFGYAEAEDVGAALNWTIRNVPSSPIILFGFGTGTTAIMRALHLMEKEVVDSTQDSLAATDNDLDLDRVSALVFDSPARDSDAFIRAAIRKENNRLMFWLSKTMPYAVRLSIGNSEQLDYFTELSALLLPVMIVGHETDNYLLPSDYRPLIEERLRLHPKRTTCHILPGEGHLAAYDENEDAYIDSLMEFMDRWFPNS